MVSSAALLVHPSPSAPLCISSDASNDGAGATLEQQINSGWQPLPFFSQHFMTTELCYSTLDKELLAAYLAVQKFQPHIEGRSCHLVRDHKPLIHAWNLRTDPWSTHQQRHLSALAELLSVITHHPGMDNIVVDVLSHVPLLSTISFGLNANDTAIALSNALNCMP